MSEAIEQVYAFSLEKYVSHARIVADERLDLDTLAAFIEFGSGKRQQDASFALAASSLADLFDAGLAREQAVADAQWRLRALTGPKRGAKDSESAAPAEMPASTPTAFAGPDTEPTVEPRVEVEVASPEVHVAATMTEKTGVRKSLVEQVFDGIRDRENLPDRGWGKYIQELTDRQADQSYIELMDDTWFSVKALDLMLVKGSDLAKLGLRPENVDFGELVREELSLSSGRAFDKYVPGRYLPYYENRTRTYEIPTRIRKGLRIIGKYLEGGEDAADFYRDAFESTYRDMYVDFHGVSDALASRETSAAPEPREQASSTITWTHRPAEDAPPAFAERLAGAFQKQATRLSSASPDTPSGNAAIFDILEPDLNALGFATGPEFARLFGGAIALDRFGNLSDTTLFQAFHPDWRCALYVIDSEIGPEAAVMWTMAQAALWKSARFIALALPKRYRSDGAEDLNQYSKALDTLRELAAESDEDSSFRQQEWILVGY